jgi:hypothetical protein
MFMLLAPGDGSLVIIQFVGVLGLPLLHESSCLMVSVSTLLHHVAAACLWWADLGVVTVALRLAVVTAGICSSICKLEESFTFLGMAV